MVQTGTRLYFSRLNYFIFADEANFDPEFDGQFDVHVVTEDSKDKFLRTVHVDQMICMLSGLPASDQEFDALYSFLRKKYDLVTVEPKEDPCGYCSNL